MSKYFYHKYRVRRNFFGKAVLQKLITKYDWNKEPFVVWVDVPYKEAPRALTTEINE